MGSYLGGLIFGWACFGRAHLVMSLNFNGEDKTVGSIG